MKAAAGIIALGLVAACTPPPRTTLPGVIEAEFVRVAPPLAGRLVELSVARGDAVQAGAALFRVESPEDGATLAEAQARVAQQLAQRADLAHGKRPAELAVTAAQLAQARSAFTEAEAQLKRERELARQGFVSGTRLDSLSAHRNEAAAKVDELRAVQRVGRLAGRDDALHAADAALLAAQAQAEQVRARLADKRIAAPANALVDDTLFRVGEWVPAGAPVVSLLPAAALKLRFYVAEATLPRIKPGSVVTLSCDGCAAPVNATVRFIATRAEFTPPVIYSREQRAKLVYLVEAWPAAADAANLRPGQPVDVTLATVP
jgi:HlyD family secretion protein